MYVSKIYFCNPNNTIRTNKNSNTNDKSKYLDNNIQNDLKNSSLSNSPNVNFGQSENKKSTMGIFGLILSATAALIIAAGFAITKNMSTLEKELQIADSSFNNLKSNILKKNIPLMGEIFRTEKKATLALPKDIQILTKDKIYSLFTNEEKCEIVRYQDGHFSAIAHFNLGNWVTRPQKNMVRCLNSREGYTYPLELVYSRSIYGKDGVSRGTLYKNSRPATEFEEQVKQSKGLDYLEIFDDSKGTFSNAQLYAGKQYLYSFEPELEKNSIVTNKFLTTNYPEQYPGKVATK